MDEKSISLVVFNAQYFSGPKDNDKRVLIPFDKDYQISLIKSFADFCQSKNPDLIVGNEFQENSSPTHNVDQANLLKEELKTRGLGEYGIIRMGGFNFEESESPLIWKIARSTYNNEFMRENLLINKLGFGKVEIPDEKLGPVQLHTSDVILTKNPFSEQNHRYFFPTPATKLQFYWNFVTRKDERQGVTSCKIEHPAFQFIIHALHLENADKKRRKEQADRVCEIIDDYLDLSPGLPQIIAGDFNSSPEGRQKSFRLDKKIDGLEKIIRHPALRCHSQIYPQEKYTPSPRIHATYPSLNPTSIFDGAVITKDLCFLEYEVCRIGLADHEPVYCRIAKKS